MKPVSILSSDDLTAESSNLVESSTEKDEDTEIEEEIVQHDASETVDKQGKCEKIDEVEEDKDKSDSMQNETTTPVVQTEVTVEIEMVEEIAKSDETEMVEATDPLSTCLPNGLSMRSCTVQLNRLSTDAIEEAKSPSRSRPSTPRGAGKAARSLFVNDETPSRRSSRSSERRSSTPSARSTRSQYLAKSMDTDSESEDDIDCSCDNCGRKFHHLTALRIHLEKQQCNDYMDTTDDYDYPSDLALPKRLRRSFRRSSTNSMTDSSASSVSYNDRDKSRGKHRKQPIKSDTLGQRKDLSLNGVIMYEYCVFKCSNLSCLKKFHTEEAWLAHSDATSHMNRMMIKSYSCKNCEKSFALAKLCATHSQECDDKQSTSSEEPNGIDDLLSVIKCLPCGKSFLSKDNFDNHLLKSKACSEARNTGEKKAIGILREGPESWINSTEKQTFKEISQMDDGKPEIVADHTEKAAIPPVGRFTVLELPESAPSFTVSEKCHGRPIDEEGSTSDSTKPKTDSNASSPLPKFSLPSHPPDRTPQAGALVGTVAVDMDDEFAHLLESPEMPKCEAVDDNDDQEVNDDVSDQSVGLQGVTIGDTQDVDPDNSSSKESMNACVDSDKGTVITPPTEADGDTPCDNSADVDEHCMPLQVPEEQVAMESLHQPNVEDVHVANASIIDIERNDVLHKESLSQKSVGHSMEVPEPVSSNSPTPQEYSAEDGVRHSPGVASISQLVEEVTPSHYKMESYAAVPDSNRLDNPQTESAAEYTGEVETGACVERDGNQDTTTSPEISQIPVEKQEYTDMGDNENTESLAVISDEQSPENPDFYEASVVLPELVSVEHNTEETLQGEVCETESTTLANNSNQQSIPHCAYPQLVVTETGLVIAEPDAVNVGCDLLSTELPITESEQSTNITESDVPESEQIETASDEVVSEEEPVETGSEAIVAESESVGTVPEPTVTSLEAVVQESNATVATEDCSSNIEYYIDYGTAIIGNDQVAQYVEKPAEVTVNIDFGSSNSLPIGHEYTSTQERSLDMTSNYTVDTTAVGEAVPQVEHTKIGADEQDVRETLPGSEMVQTAELCNTEGNLGTNDRAVYRYVCEDVEPITEPSIQHADVPVQMVEQLEEVPSAGDSSTTEGQEVTSDLIQLKPAEQMGYTDIIAEGTIARDPKVTIDEDTSAEKINVNEAIADKTIAEDSNSVTDNIEGTDTNSEDRIDMSDATTDKESCSSPASTTDTNSSVRHNRKEKKPCYAPAEEVHFVPIAFDACYTCDAEFQVGSAEETKHGEGRCGLQFHKKRIIKIRCINCSRFFPSIMRCEAHQFQCSGAAKKRKMSPLPPVPATPKRSPGRRTPSTSPDQSGKSPLSKNIVSPKKESSSHCPKCNKKFVYTKAVLNHLIMSHGLPTKEAQQLIYERESPAKNREKILPCSQWNHVCDKCEIPFANQKLLNNHKEKYCSGSHVTTEFPCVDCDLKFVNRQALKAHRVQKHKEAMITQEIPMAESLKLDDDKSNTWPKLSSEMEPVPKKLLKGDNASTTTNLTKSSNSSISNKLIKLNPPDPLDQNTVIQMVQQPGIKAGKYLLKMKTNEKGEQYTEISPVEGGSPVILQGTTWPATGVDSEDSDGKSASSPVMRAVTAMTALSTPQLSPSSSISSSKTASPRVSPQSISLVPTTRPTTPLTPTPCMKTPSPSPEKIRGRPEKKVALAQRRLLGDAQIEASEVTNRLRSRRQSGESDVSVQSTKSAPLTRKQNLRSCSKSSDRSRSLSPGPMANVQQKSSIATRTRQGSVVVTRQTRSKKIVKNTNQKKKPGKSESKQVGGSHSEEQIQPQPVSAEVTTTPSTSKQESVSAGQTPSIAARDLSPSCSVHDGENKYVCPHCENETSFSKEYSFQSHLAWVHGFGNQPTTTTQLTCPMCKDNQKFDNEAMIQCHMKWRHNIENYSPQVMEDPVLDLVRTNNHTCCANLRLIITVMIVVFTCISSILYNCVCYL